MFRPSKILVLLLTLLLAGFLAGCGGGGSTTPANLQGGNEPAALGAVELLLDFQPPTRVLGRLPAATAEIVVHLLDPATGVDVVPPVTVPHQAGQTDPVTVTLQDVPPGNWLVFLEVRDGAGQSLGYRNEPVVIPAGGRSQVEVGNPQAPKTLTVTPASVEVAVGATAPLVATLELADNSTTVVTNLATWTSDSDATATLSNSGVVTGVAQGLTSLQAAYAGLTARVPVAVVPAGATLDTLEVTPTGASLAVGQTLQFAATGHYSDSSTLDLTALCTWASTNPAFATVDAAGLVTAVAQGTPQIRATCKAVSGQTGLAVLPPVQPIAWTLRSRAPKRAFLGVAYGLGTYLAVDDSGSAWRSQDGLHWADPVQVTGDSSALNDVAFGNNLFVAAGADGQAYSSPDGTTWTLQDLNGQAAGAATSVAFGNGTFVVAKTLAIARRGALFSSSNGSNWVPAYQYDLGQVSQGYLNAVACVRYANNSFVASGAETSFYYSGNGSTWNRALITNPEAVSVTFHTLAYGNGVWLAGSESGHVTGSATGTFFAPPIRPTGARLKALGFGANQFVMFNQPNSFDGLQDQATLKTSADGGTWTTRSVSQRLGIQRCEFLNGRFVAVGQTSDGASNAALRRPMVLVSQDALTWTTGWGAHLNRVLAGQLGPNSGFVAVGEGGAVQSSTDGILWDLGTTGSLLDLVGATLGTDRLVVVGSTWVPPITNGVDAGKNGFYQTTLRSSPDGENWTEHALNLADNQTLDSVAFGNGVYVAAGGDSRSTGATGAPVLLRSTDGQAWSPVTLPQGLAAAGRFRNVEFVNGQFFVSAPGTTQKLWMTSPDGLTWTALAIPGSELRDYASVGFLNGRYLITDVAGMGTATSTNGTTWTWASFTGFQPNWLARAFAGVWVGVNRANLGGDFNPVYAAALGSGLNGLSWTQRFADTEESAVRELTYRNGTWVAVGERSLVVTSTPDN